jgi:hypothetical protein
MFINLYKTFRCNILENPISLIDRHKNINVDLIMKNLYISTMKGEKFLSLLQVCKNF